MTALAVVSLIEEGRLELAATARSVLGRDLPLIDDEVTVEQLLAHRSGIGDYLDEEDEDLDFADYLLPVPVHELATTEQYSPYSMDTRRSSRPANASPTATAATSCWR